jgi:hypothetical protein
MSVRNDSGPVGIGDTIYSCHSRSKVFKFERTTSSSGNGISDSRMHIVIVHGDTAFSVLEFGGVEGWHQSISLVDMDSYASVPTHVKGVEDQRGGSHHAVAAFRVHVTSWHSCIDMQTSMSRRAAEIGQMQGQTKDGCHTSRPTAPGYREVHELFILVCLYGDQPGSP